MHYISLLVHENLPVVLDTLDNMMRQTDACVVLHRSKGATFGAELLLNIIRNRYRDRVILNPHSLKTYWGNIYFALRSNLRFILSLAGPDDKISFHASNDLFIKKGVSDYLNGKYALFHQRIYCEKEYWSQARMALEDPSLMTFLKKNNIDCIVGSQFEGSMYPALVLKEFLSIIDKEKLLSGPDYAKEEIIFSTLAYMLGVKPSGCPYVYSELHKIDASMFKVSEFCDHLPSFIGFPLETYLQHRIWVDPKYRINKRDIDSLLDNSISLPIVKDKKSVFVPYDKASSLYCVKRVNRIIGDDVRCYISSFK